MSNDRQIREKMKQKDMDFQKELKDVMEEQQKNLKHYFKQFKQPVKDDPTKIKRSDAKADQVGMMKNMISIPFSSFVGIKQLWNLKCNTSREAQTLEMCKRNMVKRICLSVGFSLMIVGFVSYKNRTILPMINHVFGVSIALIGGTLWGVISSSKFTLAEFEKLGPSYELGRSAIASIQKYRMDQHII